MHLFPALLRPDPVFAWIVSIHQKRSSDRSLNLTPQMTFSSPSQNLSSFPFHLYSLDYGTSALRCSRVAQLLARTSDCRSLESQRFYEPLKVPSRSVQFWFQKPAHTGQVKRQFPPQKSFKIVRIKSRNLLPEGLSPPTLCDYKRLKRTSPGLCAVLIPEPAHAGQVKRHRTPTEKFQK